MRTLYLLILFVLTFRPGSAQDDILARNLLNRLSGKSSGYSGIRAEFRFTTIDLLEKQEHSQTGTIFIKQDKYRIKLTDTETYFNGKTMWNHLLDVQEVNVTQPGEEERFAFSNPKQIFSFDEKDFKSFYVGESLQKGKKIHELELVPCELKKDYSKIRLWIDENSQVTAARFYGKSGIHYLIEITGFDGGQKFDDAFFSFDPRKHPGVEVIDMR